MNNEPISPTSIVDKRQKKNILIPILFCLSFFTEGQCHPVQAELLPHASATGKGPLSLTDTTSTTDTSIYPSPKLSIPNRTIANTPADTSRHDADTLTSTPIAPATAHTATASDSIKTGKTDTASISTPPTLPLPEDSAKSIIVSSRQDSLCQMLLDEFFLSDELRFYNTKLRYPTGDSARIEAWKNLSLEIPACNTPDSVYRARLDSLNQSFLVKLSYNQTVRNYIEVYVNKRRQQVDVMLALSQYYFPIFEQAMEQNGVPEELKYLAIIESGLNPRAVSRAGASGCWQFMYGTGKMYNLDIDLAVDERLDPFKASDAAARYLKDLYDSFGDWTLAIAAYNCGPGNVRKAIRRARGKTDFWQIYPFLPRETRGYVPAFIGATYAMNFSEEHGIPFRSQPPILTDTLMVDQDLNLKVVAEHLDIPLQILRDLNPQYRMDVIPGNTDYYSIRLPINFKVKFMENAQDIYADSDNAMPPTPARFQHRVQKGETLSGIAAKYHVSVSHIISLNHLKSSTIYPNQLLYIYSNRISSKSEAKASPNRPKPEQPLSPGTYTHKVKNGESVYAISKMYPGSTVKGIIQENQLDAKGRIYPGQTLRIQVGKP